MYIYLPVPGLEVHTFTCPWFRSTYIYLSLV